MKVKELIEILKTKIQDAIVSVYMNGNLGPQVMDDIDENYDLHLDSYNKLRFPSDCGKESNVKVVMFSCGEY